MRFYGNFKEAFSEIERDLAEMGIKVHPHSYQDKIVKDDLDFETLELQDYIYKVTNPRLEDLEPTQPWAVMEFEERICGVALNPGTAWIRRDEVWNQFLESDGKFGYTYSERMYFQLETLIKEAKDNPDSRQLYLSIWDPNKDYDKLGGRSRVPCSLGYLFQIRKGKLNIKYFMRSCDYVTHFTNDIYLAHRLQRYFAKEVGVEVGDFTHYMGSLHVFQKDVKEVF